MLEGPAVVFRGVVSFLTLLIMARILGKTQISQLTYFEYIVGITVGSITASMTVDLNIRPLSGWIGLATWITLAAVLEYVTMKWRWAAKVLKGEPTVVVAEGQILENNLRVMRYEIDDILGLLRNKDVFDVSDVKIGILETNGDLSIQKWPNLRPLTPQDIGMSKAAEQLAMELIYEGEIMEHNLHMLRLDRDWLKAQLDSRNLDMDEVAFAALDSKGNLYVDLYRDRFTIPVDISDYRGPG
ncbi:MAG: DUF421 domain-containing protein [Bacillota bacterium]